MDETTARAMIKDHFETATDDIARSSEIYADDAVLEFPQGRERIRTRAAICAMRSAYPARLAFQIHRTVGFDDLWVNEYTIQYDHGNRSTSSGSWSSATARSSVNGSISGSHGTPRPGGRNGWNGSTTPCRSSFLPDVVGQGSRRPRLVHRLPRRAAGIPRRDRGLAVRPAPGPSAGGGRARRARSPCAPIRRPGSDRRSAPYGAPGGSRRRRTRSGPWSRRSRPP
jgi:hypothetical protein